MTDRKKSYIFRIWCIGASDFYAWTDSAVFHYSPLLPSYIATKTLESRGESPKGYMLVNNITTEGSDPDIPVRNHAGQKLDNVLGLRGTKYISTYYGIFPS